MRTIILALLIPLFCVNANAELLKQSTARNIMFLMISSADHITGATGATVTCTLSKNAGSFGASGGSVSEVSSGWYYLAANTTDTGTLGDLVQHCTASGADPTDMTHQVVADLPGATVSSVTGAVGSVTGAVGSVTGAVGSVTGNVGGNVVGSVASVTAGVTVTTNNDKTGYTASTVSDKTGYSLSSGGVQAVWDALTSALTTTGSIGKLLSTDIDATISSRLATSGYTVPDNSSVTAIKAKTDNLPAAPAAVSDVTTVGTTATNIYSRIGAPVGASISADIASVKTAVLAIPTTDNSSNVTAIKAVTDQIGFTSGNVNARAITVADKTGYSLAANQIPVKKNTALSNFQFPMTGTSSGVPTASLTISCQRAIDGGTFANCTNSVAEIGSGYYRINFSAADLNGDTIVVRFFGTGAKEKSITLVTQ